MNNESIKAIYFYSRRPGLNKIRGKLLAQDRRLYQKINAT